MRLPAENIKAAREVQLVDFLNTYRPGELVRKSRDEYCTKSHSSLRITPSKNLFHWCSQSKGGRGALDYLLTVEGMSFRSAVMLLNEMELIPFQQVRAATVESSRTHDFTLPRPDKNAQAATAYLMHRGISPKVLRYCLNVGILYQTTRGNYCSSHEHRILVDVCRTIHTTGAPLQRPCCRKDAGHTTGNRIAILGTTNQPKPVFGKL